MAVLRLWYMEMRSFCRKGVTTKIGNGVEETLERKLVNLNRRMITPRMISRDHLLLLNQMQTTQVIILTDPTTKSQYFYTTNCLFIW